MQPLTELGKYMKKKNETEQRAEHTAGPWGIRHYNSPSGVCYQIAIGLRELPRLSGCATINRPDKTDEANARLIAAAPELLAACERLLCRLNHFTEKVESCDLSASDELAMEEASAAISKAKGNQ